MTHLHYLMRILFINNFRYRGGGEEFLMELLPGLIKRVRPSVLYVVLKHR